ncbi:MAG TPA: SGNH/GDSL hydrolase family protein, partial [Tepidisphaeraceae bacterium]|nr:SGNH/GDSL hydrolase family protein [Tepidisphaeraceae bacterium]
MTRSGLLSALASAAIALGAGARGASAQPQETLKFEKGSHICLVGNTLGERMEHDGWLEATIQSRFPQDQLMFRNLCEAADQVDLRLRVQGFGTPDEWLERGQADVIFAFFGFNESFEGQKGVEKFKNELETYVKHLQGMRYNGRSAPKIVLFSSIAQEKINDPNLPDNAQNNKNIEMYAQATRQVAQDNGVIYVDLFNPSLQLYSKATKPLTIDCIHLTADGDRQIANVIADQLFPGSSNGASLDKLR